MIREKKEERKENDTSDS